MAEQTPQDIRLASDVAGAMLEAIESPGKLTRDEAAVMYAWTILICGTRVDVRAINKAIVERWSMDALLYIKDRAWKRLESPQ